MRSGNQQEQESDDDEAEGERMRANCQTQSPQQEAHLMRRRPQHRASRNHNLNIAGHNLMIFAFIMHLRDVGVPGPVHYGEMFRDLHIEQEIKRRFEATSKSPYEQEPLKQWPDCH